MVCVGGLLWFVMVVGDGWCGLVCVNGGNGSVWCCLFCGVLCCVICYMV